MRRATRTERMGRGRLGDNRGFTLVEIMAVAGVSIVVVFAAAVAYQGTVLSWRGTTALLGLQRDASIACEMIQNRVRPASNVVISAGGDSLEIYFEDASGGDSLGALFYADGSGNVRDLNGTIISSGLDTLRFSMANGSVNVDFVLADDVGTANRLTDDQAVYMSSTAIVRN